MNTITYHADDYQHPCGLTTAEIKTIVKAFAIAKDLTERTVYIQPFEGLKLPNDAIVVSTDYKLCGKYLLRFNYIVKSAQILKNFIAVYKGSDTYELSESRQIHGVARYVWLGKLPCVSVIETCPFNLQDIGNCDAQNNGTTYKSYEKFLEEERNYLTGDELRQLQHYMQRIAHWTLRAKNQLQLEAPCL